MDGQGSRKTWPPCLWVTTLLKLGKSVLPNSSQTRENMVSVALSVHMIRWLLIPEYLNSSGTSRRQAQDRSDSSPGDSMFWDVDEIKKKKKRQDEYLGKVFPKDLPFTQASVLSHLLCVVIFLPYSFLFVQLPSINSPMKSVSLLFLFTRGRKGRRSHHQSRRKTTNLWSG